ncbi:MAG: GlxA family transcriptional regulator [Gammaproteobacteria bacterium]
MIEPCDFADSLPPRGGAATPVRFGIILANHFTLSAFSIFIDHLRLAADEGDRSRPLHMQWSVMASREEPVRASCGVMVNPSTALLDPRSLDYVVVVGGLLQLGPQIDESTTQYLRDVAAAGVRLVGTCTASFVLCRAGLMKGRTSCVSWYHYQDFLEEFPNHPVVADRLFVEDGDRITCAGGAGSAAVATHLIERHLGRAVAQKASQVLLFDRERSGSEAQPRPPLYARVSEPRVRRALLLMEQNLARPIAIPVVAEELGLSMRQLERLCRTHTGLSPASIYRQLRMRYARWLVENTDRSVTEIAIDAGFADCAHFSRQFKDAYGLSPSNRRLNPQQLVEGGAGQSRVFE